MCFPCWSFNQASNRTVLGQPPQLYSQRAPRDILMPPGKNCLPIVSRQFLTLNYPRPNCLIKCLPNCLSPTLEDIFFLFQNCPRGEGNCAAIFAAKIVSRQFLPRGIKMPLRALWAWNPSEPYSDKEISLRRALRRSAFLVGFSTGTHRKSGLSPLGTVHETVLGRRQKNGATNNVDNLNFCKFSAPLTICHENITQLIRKISNRVTVIKIIRQGQGSQLTQVQ